MSGPGNPYSQPYLSVTYEPLFSYFDLGYSQRFSMADVMADALTDAQAALQKNAKVGSATIQTKTPLVAKAPLDLAANGQNIPTLWFEKNTGALCLRPFIYTDTKMSLSTDCIWRIGNPNEDPISVSNGTGLMGRGTPVYGYTHPLYIAFELPLQGSQMKNEWTPLGGNNEKIDVWFERRTLGSRLTTGSNLFTTWFSKTFIGIKTKTALDHPEEHMLQSKFKLEENGSFAFCFNPIAAVKVKDSSGNLLPNFLRLYWGKQHALQWNGEKLQYTSDAWGGQDYEDVDGVSLTPNKASGYGESVCIVVQVIGNAIVINRMEDISPVVTQRPEFVSSKSGWCRRFKDKESFKSGFKIEEDNMYIGVRNLGAEFAYLPVYYTPGGVLTSRTEDAGRPLTDISSSTEQIPLDTKQIVTAFQLTPSQSSSTSFTFTVTMALAKPIVNVTPQVFSVDLKGPPAIATVQTVPSYVNGRVRSLTLDHGIFDQSGTMVVDNKNGQLKNTVGVFPVTIEAGWIDNNGTITKQTRFVGFSTNLTINKASAPYSTGTITLVGRSLQLRDAIAVNLPIYDGEVHLDAVTDLLARAGWAQPVNVVPLGIPFYTDPTFRLSVPPIGQQPLYMFSLGTPIEQCITEIARNTGYWQYTNSIGVYNYVPPFQTTSKMLYREVPGSQFGYDEMMSLDVEKSMQDVRNATLVVGLNASFDSPQYLTGLVKPPLGPIGLGDSDTSNSPNLVPWYRWILLQDPKLNDQPLVDFVARQLHDNNNRPRWNLKTKVWGNQTLFPLDCIKFKLRGDNAVPSLNDQIGMPLGEDGLWRILRITDTIDAETKMFTSNIECEFVDNRFSYASYGRP